MISLKRQIGRLSALSAAVVLGVVAVIPALAPTQVGAVGLFTPRKLTMSSQSSGNTSSDVNSVAYAAGAGGNGAKATYTFNFTASVGSQSLQSVAIQFCTTPFFGTTCTAPTGMDAANLTAGGTTVANFAATAPALDTTTTANANFFSGNACAGSGALRQNCVLLKRAAATAENATPSAFQITAGNGVTGTSWIKNPTAAGTFYARITTFSDLYTTILDQGAVTGSVQNTIDITSRVQETLNFSIGNAYTAPSTTCAVLNNTGALNLGNATNNYTLDPTLAYEATSYWRLSTNANNGSTVQYSGDTLKTAAGTAITSIGSTATLSSPGSEQFGLGQNSADVNQSLTNATWIPSAYSQANGNINTPSIAAKFAHEVASVSVPKSLYVVPASNTITCDTGSVRYVANIGTTTKPGLYQTSIAYIATPTY